MGKRDRHESGIDHMESGSLDKLLVKHAQRRCQYFFGFMFTHQRIVAEIEKRTGEKVKPAFGIDVHATEQYAKGHRSKVKSAKTAASTTQQVVPLTHQPMDKNESNLNIQPSTNATRVDAAHFCNLGVKPILTLAVIKLTDNRPNDPLTHLLERLKRFAGDTSQLPQPVNLGPDKVVDRIHGALVAQIAQGGPRVTAQFYQTYLVECDAAMAVYQDKQNAKGTRDGLAACANEYRKFYHNQTEQRDLDLAATFFGMCDSALVECQASSVDSSGYVSKAVYVPAYAPPPSVTVAEERKSEHRANIAARDAVEAASQDSGGVAPMEVD